MYKSLIAFTIFCVFGLISELLLSQNYTVYQTYHAIQNNSNWNNSNSWDNGIPTSGMDYNAMTLVIIPVGIRINFDVPNNNEGGGPNNPLNYTVIQVYGRLNLNKGEKLYIGCESAIIVYPNAYLSGDEDGQALGEKVYFCNVSFGEVWEANDWPDGQQEGYFYLGFGDIPMPVELLFFKAENSDTETHLNWATASEKNNNYFAIERAGSALDFEMIGIIGGSGNTNAPVYYSFTDRSGVLSGTSYYRLTQFDYDGTSEVIGQIAVDHKTLKAPESILFQNPILSHENLKIVLLNESSGNLKIFTIEGTQVFQAPFSPSSGKVQAGTLKPGMYVVVYESAGKATAYKLAVL